MAQHVARINARRLADLRPARSATDRMVTGLAGGIAEQLHTDAMVVRLAFVALAAAGGAGVVLYLAGWALSTRPNGHGSAAPTGTARVREVLAIGLVVAGAMILLRGAAIWFGDALAVSVGLAALGSALIWTRSGDAERPRWTRVASRLPIPAPTGLAGRLRVVAGALLVLAGMATFLAANDALAAARNVVFPIAVTVIGAGLIFGPWMLRLARQLSQERRELIRSEERADVAAHLHDSVLQTLALIQRSKDAGRMTALARGQERELRAWLYGRSRMQGRDGGEVLNAALDQMATRIEGLHEVPVEVVTVGDCPVDERIRAVVDATAEAVQNAAKHSGAAVVSVYSEADPDAVRVYVRDQGTGFDRDAVPADRRGIADSIEGRMARHGGTAVVTSQPEGGTEVRLRMPRSPA